MKSLKYYILVCMLLVAQMVFGQISVSVDGPIKSIKEAVEMAAPGSRIEVNPGVYQENDIHINKPIELVGIGLPEVNGMGNGFIFIIRADGVTINGFEITNTGQSYVRDYAAIMIEKVSDFVIENNVVDDVFFGIYLAETQRGIIRNNRVESYDLREASSGNGIHLWNAKNPQVYENTVIGMRDGIYLEFVEDADVRDNFSTENNRYGLHYMFSNGGSYYRNTFTKNGAGVAVMYSDYVDMSENNFEDNWGGAAYGLLLKDIKHSKITGNRFYRNTVAIYSEATSDVEISGNHVELNGWAVNIKSNSIGNRFTGNNFIENSLDVRTDSPRNNNVFEGNYWSAYEGYDLDRDGIGDVPYRPVSLFSVIIEKQQASLILLRSMFIRLLDTAERIMPVLTPKTLYDEKPRMERIP